MGSRGSRSGRARRGRRGGASAPAVHRGSLHRRAQGARATQSDRANATSGPDPGRNDGRAAGPRHRLRGRCLWTRPPRRTADRGQCSRSWLPGRSRDGLGGSNRAGGRGGRARGPGPERNCAVTGGRDAPPAPAPLQRRSGRNARRRAPMGALDRHRRRARHLCSLSGGSRACVARSTPWPPIPSTTARTPPPWAKCSGGRPGCQCPRSVPACCSERKVPRVCLGRPAGRPGASERGGPHVRHPTLEACLRHLLGRVGPEGTEN